MYNWTQWLDHVVTPSNCFTMTDNKDGTFTITPTGKVMQQGTPQDQNHFNNTESGIVDAHTAVGLLLNFARQNAWEIDRGTVTLTNNQMFPFNNSLKSVPLATTRASNDYVITAEVVSCKGNVGELIISEKLANGFKAAYTGSASSVTIKYTVIGGYMK